MGEVPPWFYRQVSVVPYRWQRGTLEIALITSIRRGRWVLPKGVVEPHLGESKSALLEAYEEAGLAGSLGSEVIGSYTYKKWGGTCTVAVYPLCVTGVSEDWPEKERRRRRWTSLEEALRLVERAPLRKVIRAAASYAVARSGSEDTDSGADLNRSV